jgi:hypothetical protein
MPAPRPNRVKTSDLKSRILHLAQTSVYQVKIQPPPSVAAFLQVKGFNYYFEGEDLELLCSEASLPGTFLRTHTVENDYHGVTEQMAYRRQYDDTLNLTFYVDRNYNVVEFFDSWIDFISGQGNQNVAKSPVANYRFNFPETYKNDIYLTKFEKDVAGQNLAYTFVKAFPISITSMPVSYEQSDILKCNVAFSYIRYVKERVGAGYIDFPVTGNGAPLNTPTPPSGGGTGPGAPQPPVQSNPRFLGPPKASPFLGNSQQSLNELYEAGRAGRIRSAGDFIGPVQ